MTFDNLIAIHKMLWPDTNLDQQLAKYEEEFKEWSKVEYGSEEELYEIADMVIVSAGIARFDYTIGLDFLVTALVRTEDSCGLWQAVETKMRVNMTKRNWDKDPVVGYKHKDK